MAGLLFTIACALACAASFGLCMAIFIATKNDILVNETKLIWRAIATTLTGTCMVLEIANAIIKMVQVLL